jgi:glycosyltransferase involved in cell wall biosynthesis
VRRTAFDRARVYGSLRSAHLERAHALQPASLLHRRRRYDFDPQLAEGLDLLQGRTLSMAVTLVRSRLTGLEVNEPLLRSGAWHTSVAVTAARLSARLHRVPVRVVAYAIENRDPYGGGDVPASWRGRLRRRLDESLSRYTARRVDRIAYGTAAAADLYAARLGAELMDADRSIVPALPAPCDCAAAEDRDPDRVVFVGAFQPRKGLPQLVDAWPGVVERHPGARLTLVGKGAQLDLAEDLARRVGGLDLVVDPPRAEVHRLLRRSAVLVLLSQRTPTWREQVGLPVVEGLAHGCAVVTTQETGLADWLDAHGHDALPTSASSSEVADVIARALGRRRTAASVLADLPDVDGRLAADRWLFEPDAPSR